MTPCVNSSSDIGSCVLLSVEPPRPHSLSAIRGFDYEVRKRPKLKSNRRRGIPSNGPTSASGIERTAPTTEEARHLPFPNSGASQVPTCSSTPTFQKGSISKYLFGREGGEIGLYPLEMVLTILTQVLCPTCIRWTNKKPEISMVHSFSQNPPRWIHDAMRKLSPISNKVPPG
jgi:hypothetical protein